MQKLLSKFPGLTTLGRHDSAMITNCQNSPLWDLWFQFLPLESIQSLSPGLYTAYKEPTANIFNNV